MSHSQKPPLPAVAAAELDLDRVQRKVEAARAVLQRLLQEVAVAESRLSNSQAAQILEANERLVVTALRSQAEAQTAAMALTDVTRTAETDTLTQLPNRVLLIDRFAQAIAHAKRHASRLALLFLDLDGFKQINDTLGHGVGDEVLQQVAQRLSSAVRAADTVSRHGGDEFLVLLPEVSQAADAALLARKLLANLAAPIQVNQHTLRLSASIGISLYPDDGETSKVLIDRADAAMYEAKNHGPGGCAFFSDAASRQRRPARAGPPTAREQSIAAQERSQATLREANEQLVLGALGAQQLQVAAEQARQRHADFVAAVSQELSDPHAPLRMATALLDGAGADQPLLARVQALIEQHTEHMPRLAGAAGIRALDQPGICTTSGSSPSRPP